MSLVITAHNIEKSYGDRKLFTIPLFQVFEGDKIGIIGNNGVGKSTLLKILSKQITPDSGFVEAKIDIKLLHQLEENNPTLSGGENMRKRISDRFTDPNSAIFADEPTANLDISAKKWLTQKLLEVKTLIVISHDRNLLNEICNKIAEIKDGKITFFSGNYDDYLRETENLNKNIEKKHSDYLAKKKQLSQAVVTAHSKSRSIAKPHKRRTELEYRKGKDYLASKIKKAERQTTVLKKRLQNLEKVDGIKSEVAMRLDFSLTNPPHNKNLIIAQNLNFAYNDNTPVFVDASFIIENKSKVALTGANGAGKTTLLNLIYNSHPAIKCVPKLKIGYLMQGFEDFDEGKTVLENVMTTSVQNSDSVRQVLASLLFKGDDVFKACKVLSGGERIRLGMAKLITSSCNLLLLDEPTNYLDIQSIKSMENAVKNYPGTIILVSHDENFVQSTTNFQLEIKNKAIQLKQEKSTFKKSDKLLLEMRQAELTYKLFSANHDEKDAIEAELNQITLAIKSINGNPMEE